MMWTTFVTVHCIVHVKQSQKLETGQCSSDPEPRIYYEGKFVPRAAAYSPDKNPQ